MLNEREKEIVECLVNGWIENECRLYGGLSYQCVCELLTKIGAPEAAQRVSDHIRSEIGLANEEKKFRERFNFRPLSR